ncbi:HEAT repeat-containing protein 1 [Pseudoliparis swirei]|uniref:HEAT repeat-containing protein 1 n=1 Tax=Pseudoliparis swirei TaxID=2059687 RepID=UPI0024BE6F8F|nr:HEAT repeat-containing protein 1 [Pseudoliparis swirei]
MTSLAHQLRRLALPQSDPNLLTRGEVASLLFDPKVAVSMDRSTFYALGCTGLEELMGIEPAFLEFQDTLFSRASLTLERSVQSREVNEKLDAGVSLFLARLSPYFLLKPAHKCLEWLVHRFHVQLYNADALLRCSLPFHDTNVFVRVLQLLKISAGRWSWLLGLQKAGVPLSRGALVAHCYSDLSFMDFICSLVTGSVQAYSGRSGSCSQLRVIFSFYASTIVSALAAVDKVSDAMIAKLLPFVHKGLKSSLTDYRAATLMVVCQLAVAVPLEAGLVDVLAAHVARSLLGDPVLAQEGLGCLVVLLQNQKEGSAGPRAAVSLGAMPALASGLRAVAAAHDVAPLLRYLLPHLVRAALSGSGEEDQLAVLESVLEAVPLTGGLDRTAARCVFSAYLSQADLSPDAAAAFDRRLLPLVRLLESRYGAALDGVLAAHVTGGGGEQRSLYHRFLCLSLSRGKHQSASESSALKVLEVLLDVLDPEDVVLSLLALLHSADLSVAESWLPVLTEAVRLLSDPRLGQADAELLQKAGWRLLPLLVVSSSSSSSSQLLFTSCLAHSSIVARHPLTMNWAQELDEVMKRSSEPDFLGLANERLVAVMSAGLLSMELFSRRDALERLAQAVEGQRGSGPRARASFLVLTQTLLLGLRGLSETQHLLTAQRVYALLEAPLLEATGGAAAQEDGRCNSAPPSSFSGALALYLSRCGQQPGERLDTEFSFVLIALLRDFIGSLRCHDASFKGDVWWNPEKMDTNTCCYLGLTCRLFSVIIRGAGEGPASGSFRDLMKLLIKVHLCEPPMLFRFLCLLWGYGSNHGDQLDVKVGAVLQTQALYVGGALLSAQSAAALQQLAAADSPVVPSLLCCLTSPVREVRRAALAALRGLSGAAASPFRPITERLLKNSEEIIADPAYLSQVLGALQDESAAATEATPLRASLQQLLQSAGAPGCPSYSACCLLRALSHTNGPAVLSELLPVLDRLLDQSGPDAPSLLRSEAQLVQLVLGKYNAASAPLLGQNQNCLDLFVRALRNSAQPHPDIPSCQIIALEQVSRSFFSALGLQAVQQKLLSAMLDVLVESRSPMETHAVRSAFRGMAVDGQLVANELAPPEKPKVSVTVQQSRRSRTSQRKPVEAVNGGPDGGPAGGPAGGAVPWQRVTLILELLQHKKKLKRAETLVPVLFTLLARSLDPCPSDLNMEYTKQLLLGCLLNVCHRLRPEGGAVGPDLLDEEKFSVELVVQVIRASDMPQTHHHALLLLGAAAAIFPEKVLLNIMPIFTFMGANIMRLDDAYSFRVIEQTVQVVIPALIQAHQLSDGSSSPHVVAVVTRILHVFADALPHVPHHRRLPILSQLVTTLGPARFLWVLMLLLFKLHATQTAGSTGEKDAALERDVDFWVSLCCEFTASEQLSSLVSLLLFLLKLPDDKQDAPAKRRPGPKKKSKEEEEKEVEKEVEELIFSPEAHSSKELRHFKFLSVSFMAQLLGSAGFIGKVADAADVVDESLQQRLLEEILRYIHAVARRVEDDADKPTAKFWRVLLNKAYEVLDKVNSLLPTDTFIAVMRGLMGNELPSVRRKAMELLNNKLQHHAQWEEHQVTVLLQLTGDLLSIVGQSGCKAMEAEREAEHAINRQTALYSLKLLCRSFGAAHQEAFVPVLQLAVDIITAPEEEKNVTGSALLCVAEVVGALKALAIPHLPRLVPALLGVLTHRKELLTNEIYLLSAVSALQRVPHPHSPGPPGIAPWATNPGGWTAEAPKTVPPPDPQVRFSSLLMLMELASKLKENYVVLLPETIPFLAELMEDDCEEVEQQVQKVVQEMEKILGEPLQSYF